MANSVKFDFVGEKREGDQAAALAIGDAAEQSERERL